MRSPTTLVALACAATLAPAAAHAAPVIPAPVDGRTLGLGGPTLRTADGLELQPRRDGDTLLIRSVDGFAVQERRSNGRITGLAVQINRADRVLVDLNRQTFSLNEAEWNPQPNTKYLFPNGGTMTLGTPATTANPSPERASFPIEIVSRYEDRVRFGEGWTGLSRTASWDVQVEVAPDRRDDELDGLLRFDAGTSPADDLVDRDGVPTDAAGALRAWALDARESMLQPETDHDPCRATFDDDIGRRWTPDRGGDVRAGGSADSMMSGGAFIKRRDGDPVPAWTSCTFEAGGQELAAPQQHGSVIPGPDIGNDFGPNVTTMRKTFFSRGPVPFVRHLFVLRNRTPEPRTTTLVQRFGSQSGVAQNLTQTDRGTGPAGPDTSWMVVSPGSPAASRFDIGFGVSAFVWQDALGAPDRADAVFDWSEVTPPQDPTTQSPPPAPFADRDTTLGVAFGDVRLEPYEMAAYMTVQLLDDWFDGAAGRAASLAAAPDALFEGLSEQERRALRNWRPVGDADRDGVDDLDDRCPSVQANTPDGCPAPPAPEVRTQTVVQPVPVVAPRVRPARVTASARRSARNVRVSGRVVPPAGVRCGGWLEVSASTSKSPAVKRYLGLSSSCRYAVTVKLPARWDARKLDVRVRFGGSDRLLPRAAPKLRLAAVKRSR